ncbi:MAG TPA: zinc ABC transporter substrate-binding protein [Solirubrobacteraceae bacterium]|nr:zinc ABC transporter substrate-binding protein [Solirubrobacteraceae bacterium]
MGAESQYASVIAAVGGKAVSVSSIMNNPSVDPHSFELSPSVANEISTAQLIVQNGLGYDTFMSRVEAAAPNPRRRVIVAGRLPGLPPGNANPHLWYSPATMPAVAARVASVLASLKPQLAAYFRANVRRFDRSLRPWLAVLASIRRRFPGARVASTEPVADLMLQAAGLSNATPLSFRLDIMNGTDPAPQAISFEEGLVSRRQVRALVLNQQVTDSVTAAIGRLATSHAVPVVGVDETMPTRLDYAGWMLQTAERLERALAHG